MTFIMWWVFEKFVTVIVPSFIKSFKQENQQSDIPHVAQNLQYWVALLALNYYWHLFSSSLVSYQVLILCQSVSLVLKLMLIDFKISIHDYF